MGDPSERAFIRIRGARQNNLKGIDLQLPTRSLLVVTGLSGSGKSSLAFDTLYAEGQRRYIETFSPYARQFFDRMDKPRVDAIEGIPPAIALEQRNSVRTTRSTVGTMTEVCDYLKLLWPHLARLHCRQCGQPVRKDTPREVWDQVRQRRGKDQNQDSPANAATSFDEGLVVFRLPLSSKLSAEEQLALIARQGFQRLLIDGAILRVEDARARFTQERPDAVTVVQDRVKLSPANRARFVEACEQAYHFGHEKLAVVFGRPEAATGAPRWEVVRPFSRHLHCATCDLEYREPTPALFSFNHPLGACPKCKGFGRIIGIDYDRAIPDRSKSLGQGAVKPWQTGTGAESQADMVRFARREAVPLDVPFRELSPAQQRWVIEGDPDYGEDNEWPKAWYGVKGYFRWLESKAYKMHVRVLLSRYRAYRMCPDCEGQRLQPDALLWRLPQPVRESPRTDAAASGSLKDSRPGTAATLSLADFYALSLREAQRLVEQLASRLDPAVQDPFTLALKEVSSRLAFLNEVGVGYLTLDRPTRTLSGGETQRVNLTTCLGSGLVNTLFVLDEPSVGLHFRDTERLVQILIRLRTLGNTVVVVEHEAAVMRAADQIIDLGPGHGPAGGQLVVQGTFSEVLKHPDSLTGAYLAGRRKIEVTPRRRVDLDLPGSSGQLRPDALLLSDQSARYGSSGRTLEPTPALVLRGVNRHNLRNLDVTVPLGRLVCLSGVSGSGKTTLAGELIQHLRERLGGAGAPKQLEVRESEHEENGPQLPDVEGGAASSFTGAEHLGAFLLVDQSPIGRTPRSNPAVYTGAFEHLRELFAATEAARARGLSSSAFSFNSTQGQCEQCRGAGFEKIEMQFLSDVFIRCPACGGGRYRPYILEILLPVPKAWRPPAGLVLNDGGLSIAAMLELTVDDSLEFLEAYGSAPAERAAARLRVIRDVGLGYLRLGQPINTLSGGESQRLKLAGHMVESLVSLRRSSDSRKVGLPRVEAGNPAAIAIGKPTLFVFDEPTTGLHFEDVRVLLQVFQRLVDAGHSVLIIEHNLEVLKCADWLIDLGPDGGEEGGQVVIAGTPEDVAACRASHTGQALCTVLRGGRR